MVGRGSYRAGPCAKLELGLLLHPQTFREERGGSSWNSCSPPKALLIRLEAGCSVVVSDSFGHVQLRARAVLALASRLHPSCRGQ